MGWSSVGSHQHAYTHQRDNHQHGAQSEANSSFSPLYSSSKRYNTNIIHLFLHFAAHINQTTVTATDHHTRPSFFPPLFLFFGRNAFFLKFLQIVLYTLQLPHTTVHVWRNTKMYCQASHPRMKNPSIGYVLKLRFPASHNAHLSIPVSIPYHLICPFFLFPSFGRKSSTLRSWWPRFMLRGITPATVILAPQWLSFWILRDSVLSVSPFLQTQWQSVTLVQ
jgi:hypothetical protein